VRGRGKDGGARSKSARPPLALLSSPHLQVADAGPHVGRQLLQLLRLRGQGVEEGLCMRVCVRESGVVSGECEQSASPLRPTHARPNSPCSWTWMAWWGGVLRRACKAVLGNQLVETLSWAGRPENGTGQQKKTLSRFHSCVCPRPCPTQRSLFIPNAPPTPGEPPPIARARRLAFQPPIHRPPHLPPRSSLSHASPRIPPVLFPPMVDTRCTNRVMTGASVGGALGASIGECV